MSELIRDSQRWVHDIDDSSIAIVEKGLKVTVPPGRTWRIAAADGIRLPENVGEMRLNIAELSRKAKWLMRIYGTLRRGRPPRTVSFFEGETRKGVVTLAVDPRLLPRENSLLLQVQLGLNGRQGDYVIFESLEFLPREERSHRTNTRPQAGQLSIECVELMPNIPQPFDMPDWRELAHAFDRFVFDLDAKGQYLPLIWIDNSRVNSDKETFGLPSYVGDSNRTHGPDHESITCMGAVLGATIAGIDKRSQRHDYVLMCEAYYNVANDERLILNYVSSESGGSFWYDIWPHIVFYALADRYPNAGNMDAIIKATADRWREACLAMGGHEGVPDFDHAAFDFRSMKPVDNGKWKEPDAAAGIGWLKYMAWVKHKDKKNLQAADRCMQFLQQREKNPYYEVLLPYGALIAARMNAELGRDYDVHKFLNWCFGLSDCRGGWGVIATNWHGYDCHGLVGSVDNRGGYAFAMNTFAQVGALVPLVRYDDRYARAIGKWMLNLANAARLFYPGRLPDSHESCASWEGDPDGVIAYEGLRYEWEGKGPYATGDAVVMNWGSATNLGLYGSGYAGLLGGIVRPTSDEKILQLDCLATDFYREPAYPTYLYYNPYDEDRQIVIDVGDKPRDLYDACSETYLRRNVRSQTTITIPADSAILMVLPPTGGKETRKNGKALVNSIVIDYRRTAGRLPAN